MIPSSLQYVDIHSLSANAQYMQQKPHLRPYSTTSPHVRACVVTLSPGLVEESKRSGRENMSMAFREESLTAKSQTGSGFERCSRALRAEQDCSVSCRASQRLLHHMAVSGSTFPLSIVRIFLSPENRQSNTTDRQINTEISSTSWNASGIDKRVT
jgi:hypothetical protein